MDGWFPRLSPDGQHVAAGSVTVSVDGLAVGPGVQPVWLAADVVLFRDREQPALWRYLVGSGALERVPLDRGCNHVDANGAGQYVTWFAPPGQPTVRTSRGLEFAPAYEPTISPAGDVVAFVDGGGELWALSATQRTRLGVAARAPRWTRGGLVWVEERERHEPRLASTVGFERVGRCHRAVAVQAGEASIVLVLEDERLILYPAGTTRGWVVGRGTEFYYPDAQAVGPQRVRIVWSSSRGEPGEQLVDLTSPTTDLRLIVVGPPSPPPPSPPPPPPPDREEPPMTIPPLSEVQIAGRKHADDVFDWPVTSRVTGVRTSPTTITLEHTHSDLWEAEDFDGVAVSANLWVICWVEGRWWAGTIDWMRPGQESKDIPPAEYGPRWKEEIGQRYPGPRPGDLMGVFVSTLARLDRRSRVNERSEVVWTRFGTSEIVGREGARSEPPPPPPPPPPGGQEELRALVELVRGLAASLQSIREQQDALTGRVADLSDQVRTASARLERIDDIARDQHLLTDELKRFVRDTVHADVLAIKARRECRFL